MEEGSGDAGRQARGGREGRGVEEGGGGGVREDEQQLLNSVKASDFEDSFVTLHGSDVSVWQNPT